MASSRPYRWDVSLSVCIVRATRALRADRTTTCCLAEMAAVVDAIDEDHTVAAAEPDDDDFEAQARTSLCITRNMMHIKPDHA